MSQHALVIVTCGSDDEARRIARDLVEQSLVAGAQVLAISSVYRWQGEIVDEDEWLILCKTRTDRYEQVEARVRELHSYEVAPIYMVAMAAGSRPYLEWIDAVTAEPSD